MVNVGGSAAFGGGMVPVPNEHLRKDERHTIPQDASALSGYPE